VVRISTSGDSEPRVEAIAKNRKFHKKSMTKPKNQALEQWPISKLIPYARNPRKNDSVVNKMASSIQEFGFKIPVLARSTGEVIDGHLRLKAAQLLQIETVPVLLCDEWTEAQVKAFRLLVNRSSSWADWDEDLLSLEFADLKDFEFDLNLTGFDLSEVEGYLRGVTSPDEFVEYGEDINTEHQCPKCGYQWSGKVKAETQSTTTETHDKP
jgi:ParB-like chromosome segregation protein Spo0J